MSLTFETFGNATVQLCDGGEVILTTDPWLQGNAYFGSWALERIPTPEQVARTQASRFIWFSHGHPDHLNPDSLPLLNRASKVLVPDHWGTDITDFLRSEGFDVTVMKHRQWMPLTPSVEIMCLENWWQDAILLIRAGDALLVNFNDCGLTGERSFLKKIIRSHPNNKIYGFMLTSIESEELCYIDSQDRPVEADWTRLKKYMVQSVERRCVSMGIRTMCCSSFQHIYVRADCRGHNEKKIAFKFIKDHWSRPDIAVEPPFITVDLATGQVVRNNPEFRIDLHQVTQACGDDDWSQRLSEDEWAHVDAYFRQFETIRGKMDFLAFTVGGETRKVWMTPGAQSKPDAGQRGIRIGIPRNSLLECLKWGYIEDLMIGLFIRIEPINMPVRNDFYWLVTKLGGLRIFTKAQERAFWMHYIRRNPAVFAEWVWHDYSGVVVDRVRAWAATGPLRRPLRALYYGLTKRRQQLPEGRH